MLMAWKPWYRVESRDPLCRSFRRRQREHESKSQLSSDNVCGLRAFFTVLNVERDSLSFLQCIELAVAGGKVEEDIRTAISLGDETETLFGLFLDCACRHK